MQDSGAAYYQMRVCPKLPALTLELRTNYCGFQYSDLHKILYDAATRAGAEVIFNADVCLASPPAAQGSSASRKPSVQLRDGTVLQADMIVGADGRHSTMRTSVEGKHVEPQATNTIVFTGNIPMKRLLEDEVLEKFETTWVYWFGPRRACVGASICLISLYLLAVCHLACHSPPFRLSDCESWKPQKRMSRQTALNPYSRLTAGNTRSTYTGSERNLTLRKAGFRMYH